MISCAGQPQGHDNSKRRGRWTAGGKTVEAVTLPSLGNVAGCNPALHVFAMAIAGQLARHAVAERRCLVPDE